MNGLRKISVILLFVFVLVLENTCVTSAQVCSEISVLSESITEKHLTFWIDNNRAECNIVIMGKSGTSKITGTLRLYDETAKQNIQSWNDMKYGRLFSLSKTASVTSGHKYTLSFSGNVYNASNVAEKIHVSTTKSN